jgi:tRNA nucleotidyltransferase (CCA-adding enzyme)
VSDPGKAKPEVDTVPLARSVPEHVRTICDGLRARGHAAWVVGGCVRDHLLNALYPEEPRTPGDWDIATSARPEQVQRAFFKVVPTGIEHGTVTVLLDKVPYEVTTFRAEANYTDGRRPGEVVFLEDIAADLARRDFTVNAIAYDPVSDTLADPFDGVGDLQRRLIRAVGDPSERFAEDGLRVLRAARFLATLEFELESRTASAIQPSLSTYRKVSAERIRDEWVKAFRAKRPSLAFEAMAAHGLLAITVPELAALYGSAWWQHTLRCLDVPGASTELRLALLLLGLINDTLRPATTVMEFNSSQVEAVLTRLRFSNVERSRIARLVRHHDVPALNVPTDPELRRWLRNVGPDLVDELFQMATIRFGDDEFHALRNRVDAIRAQRPALSTKDLAVNGQDLINDLHISPGPEVGQLLTMLLEVVTEEPECNQRDVLLSRAHALHTRQR